jgi:hypothetical protein
MNERIQELIEQAREYATTRHPVSNTTLSVNSDLFEQKFAELIVRECAGIVKFTPTGVSHARIIEIIKEHFGVE